MCVYLDYVSVYDLLIYVGCFFVGGRKICEKVQN